MSGSRTPLLERLARIVGEANVLTDPKTVEPFVQDWRGAYRGRASAVVRPASACEVAEVVRTCVAAHVPMVPQGGNTGMCGGAVPDGSGTAVVLALGRMDRIVRVDAGNDSMVVEAGCILQNVQQAAMDAGRLFPLSLGAEGSCQIGGNVATNAGGLNVLRYGNTRDLVLGLQAVLADGSTWDGLRALRKDNRGYDLKQLLIGSEGTLGVITSVVLKLFPLLPRRETALVAIPAAEGAIGLLTVLRERCDAVVAYELIGSSCVELVLGHVPDTRSPFLEVHPWYVLVELAGRAHEELRTVLEEGLQAAIEAGYADDAIVAQNVAEARRLWRYREAIPEAVRAAGPALRSDIAVPVESIPRFIEKAEHAVAACMADAQIVCFGHVGDGNLHFNILPSSKGAPADWPHPLDRVLYDVVAEMDGSFSAEHGIGQAKRTELRRYKSSIEIDAMVAIKRAFDPLGLMNPGKLL